MKLYKIKISSKNQKDLQVFLNLIYKKLKKFNISILKENIFSNNTITRMSILKSPHVHKKAQEQFERRTYSKKIFIVVSMSFKFLLFVKKVKNILFSKLKIKVQLLTLPTNFFRLLNKQIKIKKSKQFLKFLDFYGEICLTPFR